ncbi:hypothetical protein H257_11900 [Aphanomyces astaci]|uniref:Uncharacterized protein n=1 Tax=Aphanomyces astaci TaxID=112090 RepID=W4G128_APHAT|nr:hypothetical protein H257_11900 [Aphanomyces astaci]ETV73405.1 hypothetical protein H257_11900 [Aphanomyces astaci]|eukprot:XP_009837280.1 hypothetical protein H257_11900 [Aphanomyces astaci]
MSHRIDPKKTRVVCPVPSCKTKWITLSNRSTDYATHKNHDGSLPSYSDRLYREMAAVDHEAFFDHWRVHLHDSPNKLGGNPGAMVREYARAKSLTTTE